jgi:hypothetical protein
VTVFEVHALRPHAPQRGRVCLVHGAVTKAVGDKDDDVAPRWFARVLARPPRAE